MHSFFKKFVSPFWQSALILVLLPILELFLLLHFLGTWLTLLSMFIGGVLGVYLARKEGMRHWNELNQLLDHGESPKIPLINGILIVSGLFLMILPGILTCLFGLFLLFPLTRFLVATHMTLRFESHRFRPHKENADSSPEIIDV